MAGPRLSLLLGLLACTRVGVAQENSNPTVWIPASQPHVTTITLSTQRTDQPHFLPTFPKTYQPSGDAGVTSILTVLTSIQSTWTAGPLYPSITNAVYQAAPTSARISLDSQGYDWDRIVQEGWYTAVPTPVQSRITEQEEALQSAFNNISAQVASPGARVQRTRVVGGVEMGAWVEMAMLVVGIGLLW